MNFIGNATECSQRRSFGRRSIIMMVGLALIAGTTLMPQKLEARIWSFECRQLFNNWKKKKRHKAFVMGHRGDTEFCGSSWSKKSKKAAINSAVSACKRAGASNCTVRAAE